MMLLGCHCALTYTKCCSSFLFVFWLCMKAATCRKFLNINGDLAFVFSVVLSFCTPYFSVILPALFHFCSFIFTVFHVQVANLCAKIARFLRTKKAWSKKFAGDSPPDPLCLPYPRGHGPPRFFRLEPPLRITTAERSFHGFAPLKEHPFCPFLVFFSGNFKELHMRNYNLLVATHDKLSNCPQKP